MSKPRTIQLLNRIAIETSALGFKPIKQKRLLIRADERRTEMFGFTCAGYTSGLPRVYPYASVRFSDIEEIYKDCFGYDKYVATVGVDYWSSSRATKYSYPLSSDEEVERAAIELCLLLQEQSIPYFAKYCSIESVDLALNSFPDEWVDDCGSPDRYFRGLISARIMGRSDYDYLVKVYRDKMVQIGNGFYLPQFDLLIERLNEQTSRAGRA